MNRVAIFIGSDSDAEVIQEAVGVLEGFGISYTLEVTSAHRSPSRTVSLVRKAEAEGAAVFIAAAGKAAHLAGVVAAHTVKPVIGVPVESSSLGGLDALLSTIQMPKGVPVATMALGRTGAANAAYLAAQILGLADPALKDKLEAHKKKMEDKVEEASLKLRRKKDSG